jgi:cytochrome c-type biogenesis protein CcmH
VNLSFYLVASAMIALALLLIIKPLLQEGWRQKTSRGPVAAALLTAVLLPSSTVYLYTRLGTPAALDSQVFRNAHNVPGAASVSASLASAVDQRQEEIKKWLITAHAYDTEQRPADAKDAYGHVLKIDGKNAIAMVGWVEADMSQHADYFIDDSSRQLLEQAIALDASNQRALWLLGISDFQQKNYAGASANWRHLQQLLGDGSALAQSVKQQIANADARAKMNGSGSVAMGISP